MTVRILHFADAHIDMANYGRLDPDALLPVRVTDYLKSLDTIVDTAIERRADLVIFAGDAYKDRNPHPTFQREWGRRLIRLSRAKIPTLLLVGNHDVSPAAGRAHTLSEYDTLQVPNVLVADRFRRFEPAELGLPLQIIAIPWIPRSHLMTRGETGNKSLEELLLVIEQRVTETVDNLLATADPALPTILAAHASVAGARYGSERMVMLGNELVLSGSLVRDPRLDYVALGHIHRHQDLNAGGYPPVVYPGSIERIDFGEAHETKGYVWVEIEKGATTWEFIPLQTRPFIDRRLTLTDSARIMSDILAELPAAEALTGAIVRLELSYPADWEVLIDDAALKQALAPALEWRVLKNRQTGLRARLDDSVGVASLSPSELLSLYWKSVDMDPDEAAALQALGEEIIRAVDQQIPVDGQP